MTANHTPKLNLMSPVDSDTFAASDFADTFSKIDNAPGVATVANYSALQGLGWGTNQNGRKVIQLDNLAEWIWINPSGSGTWLRTNTVGLLNKSYSSTAVSTSGQTGLGIQALQTGNITAPGGRALHINVLFGADNTVGAGSMIAVNLTDNGTAIAYVGYRTGGAYFSGGNHAVLDTYVQNPTPGSVHNFAFFVRAETGSASSGGGGTVTCREVFITVSEV